MPGLALFDLDNTLVDRRGAFSAWASRFVESLDGGPDDVTWLVDADRDGRTPLTTLFVAVKDRWSLAASPDELVASYRGTQTDFYRPEPAIVDPLRRLREAGWLIGVVTNGAPVQHRKVARAGLADLVDVVCVSSEVGRAKPHPAIFFEACRVAPQAGPDDTVMVGDDPEADIAGARALGFTTIWLDRGRPWPDLGFRPDHTVGSVVVAVDVIVALDE